MVCKASGHRWCSVLPFGLDQTIWRLILEWQGESEAHVWSSEVVKGLKEAHSSSHVVPVLAEAQGFARKRSERLTHSEIEALNQAGTDGKTKCFEPLSTTENALTQELESAMLLLFDNLSVDQFRMRLHDRVFGATSLARPSEGFDLMIDSHQGRQVGAESVTEKARYPHYHHSRHLDQEQRTLEGPWSNKGGQHQTKLRGMADPDPLSAILAGSWSLSIWTPLIGSLSLDEVPHLIQLDLRYAELTQEMLVDLRSFPRSSLEPLEDGLLGHSEHKAYAGKINSNQQHFQSHYDLLLGCSEIMEDCVPSLGEACVTNLAVENASFATLSQVGRDRPNISTVHQSMMRTVWVGASLPPVLGLSQGASSEWLIVASNHIGGVLYCPLLSQNISG